MVEVGEIKLSHTTDVRVTVSEYNGELGVDIRKYVNSEKYTGPTLQGVRLHKNALDSLIMLLVDNDLAQQEFNAPFGKIAKSVDVDFIVQVSTFSGSPKLDVREELTTSKGKFLTKKGISLPLKEANHLLEMLKEAQWAYDNYYPDHKNN